MKPRFMMPMALLGALIGVAVLYQNCGPGMIASQNSGGGNFWEDPTLFSRMQVGEGQSKSYLVDGMNVLGDPSSPLAKSALSTLHQGLQHVASSENSETQKSAPLGGVYNGAQTTPVPQPPPASGGSSTGSSGGSSTSGGLFPGGWNNINSCPAASQRSMGFRSCPGYRPNQTHLMACWSGAELKDFVECEETFGHQNNCTGQAQWQTLHLPLYIQPFQALGEAAVNQRAIDFRRNSVERCAGKSKTDGGGPGSGIMSSYGNCMTLGSCKSYCQESPNQPGCDVVNSAWANANLY